MALLPDLGHVGLSRRAYEVTGRVEHNANPEDVYLLVLPVSRGRLQLRREGDVVHHGDVGPGMVRVVPPGEHSSMSLTAAFESVVLHVPSATVDAAADRLGDVTAPASVARRGVLTSSADVRRIGVALRAAQSRHTSPRDLVVEGLTTALLGLVLARPRERSRVRPVEPLDDEQWSAAVEFAEASMAEKLHLAEWSDAVDLPVDEFARRFRARVGVSPYAWYLDRRVEAATEMLRTTGAQLSDVATATGFASQSHFTDAFRERTGLPPGRWRAVMS